MTTPLPTAPASIGEVQAGAGHEVGWLVWFSGLVIGFHWPKSMASRNQQSNSELPQGPLPNDMLGIPTWRNFVVV